MSFQPAYFAQRIDGIWQVSRNRQFVESFPDKSDAWKEAQRLARGAGGVACLIGRGGIVIARNVYISDD
mgnify:CR=1 FL=1